MKIINLSPNRYRSKNKIPESESYYIQLSILACVHFIHEHDHLKEIADQTLLLKNITSKVSKRHTMLMSEIHVSAKKRRGLYNFHHIYY